MKKISSIVLFIMLPFVCNGQDSVKNSSISFHFGPSYLVRQDLIFSPFLHKDNSMINLGITYTKDAKLFQSISLRYGAFNPMISDPYEFLDHDELKNALPHSFNLIDLDYSIGKKISKKESSTIIIGGIVSSDIQALNYVYGRIGNFGYYSSFGLGGYVKKEFSLNPKNFIFLEMRIPLLFWVARSPYLVNDDEYIENIASHSGIRSFFNFLGDGHLTSLNEIQTFDFGVNYNYQFRESIAIGLSYAAELVHSSQPKDFLSIRQSLNFSTKLRF